MDVDLAKTNVGVEKDRRRPGRGSISPELVHLLRDPAALPLDTDSANEKVDVTTDIRTDNLASARGVAMAVAMSIPLWCGIIGGAYALFW